MSTQEQQNPSAADPAETIGPARGTLVIVGGGEIGPEIWNRFIALAGGADARIVVIPTAQEDGGVASGDKTAADLERHGVRYVRTLHTRDPKEADTEAFTAPLREATGVWFTGGRQWRIADAYLNTRTQREFEALLARGGVIGGTSAGATIQGSFLARGDTAGNELLIGDHVEGFAFVKNSAIDQHLLRRNRQFDLIPVIETYPDLLGIGIDEGTAAFVQGNSLEVVGASYVAIYDAQTWGDGEKSPNKAATKGKYYLLAPAEKFDLKTRTIVPREDKTENSKASA